MIDTMAHVSDTGLIAAPSSSSLPTTPSSSSFPASKRSHYQTFSQRNLPKEKEKEKTKLLHRRSFLPEQSQHLFPVTMGFISKKGKEKEKEKEQKSSKGKGKGKESSLSSSSLKPKKKHSVARLLMLAAADPTPTVILPPSPTHSRLHVHEVQTAAPSPFDEKPGPFTAPVILNDDDHQEKREISYAEGEASGSVFRFKKRLAVDRGMKVQPYGELAVYPKSYDHMSLENDRYFNILLRRINPTSSPSFHDYSKPGESPPSRALDLGCGEGHWLVQATTEWSASEIVGLDMVDVTLPAIKERKYPNVKFFGGNFLHYPLPFSPNSFDYVRIANLGLAIPGEKWNFVLRECQRVLTRGGRLEIIDDDLMFPYAPNVHGDDEDALNESGLDDDDFLLGLDGLKDWWEDEEQVDEPVTVGDEQELEPTSTGDTLETVPEVDSGQPSPTTSAPPPPPPQPRPRTSSLLHGPRGPTTSNRLSLSGESWKKRLGVDDESTLVDLVVSPEELPESLLQTPELEIEESDGDNSRSSSSSSEEDFRQQLLEEQQALSIPEIPDLAPSPIFGPRPNARPMSMNGVEWKDRLQTSPFTVHEEIEEEYDDDHTNRISTSSEGSACSHTSSVFSCRNSTLSTTETDPSSVEEDSKPLIRPLPTTPTTPSILATEDTSSVPTVVIDEAIPVSQGGDDNKALPRTPMTDTTVTNSRSPSPEFSSSPSRETRLSPATNSQTLEQVYLSYLQSPLVLGTPEPPSAFLDSALEKVFGSGKAGRMSSVHLMIAPGEFWGYLENEKDNGKEKEKKGIRWSDDVKTEQVQRSRSDSSASVSESLPPGLSTKAAAKLGITYSALASAAAEARPTSPSPARPSHSRASSLTLVPQLKSSSSSGSKLKSSAKPRLAPAPSQYPRHPPGLLMWPNTLLPMPPAELEMHACKNIHDLLGCKPGLMHWIGGYVDADTGERVIGEREAEEGVWEYECYRRKRFGWADTLPETDLNKDVDGSHANGWYTRKIEIPNGSTTPRTPSFNHQASPRKLKRHSKSDSSSSSGTAIPDHASSHHSDGLAGGIYARDELTHVRTVRVYEAVKSWRYAQGEKKEKEAEAEREDENKTPTSAEPPTTQA